MPTSANRPSALPAVLIEERLTATVSREGGADAVEVQGQVSLTVRDEAAATLSLRLQDEGRAGFQFKTHPNVDKQAYASSGAIQLRDPARPFPLNTALAVLKWRVAGADEGMLPITVTCWPNPGAEETAMTLEYECPDWASLMDVVIRGECGGENRGRGTGERGGGVGECRGEGPRR